MGGFDDDVAIVGDWMPPSPSPRSFFSSMINNDDTAVRSVADVGIESESVPNFPRQEEQDASGVADQSDPTQACMGDYGAGNSNAVTELRTSSRGGLVDRIAARAGFNAPRLNTESIKTAELSENSEVQSPYLTIPPGLSPTTLLDSPVFLANSMVLPSPTTGKFPFASGGMNHNSTLMTTDSANKGKENTFNSAMPCSFAFKPDPFAFKPSLESKPFFAANKVQQPCGFTPQSFPGTDSVVSDTVFLHPSGQPPNFQMFSNSLTENGGGNVSLERGNSVGIVENSLPIDDLREDDGDQRSSGDPSNGGSQGDDGYNWRKYGQKQVKGSEYPRSYYKCTHQNCAVKKKVERNHEGHDTEIIYKGVHNHPKPLPHRRSMSSSLNAPADGNLESGTGAVANGGLSWLAMQNGNVTGAMDWRQEATSSAPLVVQDYVNGNGSAPQHEAGDGLDGSCTFSNDEDDDDHVTHGSVSLGQDGEGEESESKRRKIEPYCLEITGTARSIREPRVVVQTTSEVDILDDGYRWRKYGQKVVKGNPNPRSYYKCTSPGCNVRKHVERASHDLKSVITTYEGKHNHDVPAARNSSHINSGNASILPQAVHRGIPPQFERPPFGLPGRAPMQPGPAPGFAFGINQHGITAAAMQLAGLGHSHPYFGRQPRPESNGLSCFMMPKAEPAAADGRVNTSDGSSSAYQQLMSRMPLGPHM